MPDHHLPHIFLDDIWYMITSSTYQKQHYFSPDGYKDCVRDQIKDLAKEFETRLAAWVSYRDYLAHKGEAWLMDAFDKYPVIDFSVADDNY